MKLSGFEYWFLSLMKPCHDGYDRLTGRVMHDPSCKSSTQSVFEKIGIGGLAEANGPWKQGEGGIRGTSGICKNP